MIKGSFYLFPPDGGRTGFGIAEFTIWTEQKKLFSSEYTMHCYRVIAGGLVFEGSVEKNSSGHRNLFHLLEDVCNDIVESNDLPLNYLPTPEGALKWREQAKSTSPDPSAASVTKKQLEAGEQS